jgi:hypothetical protein
LGDLKFLDYRFPNTFGFARFLAPVTSVEEKAPNTFAGIPITVELAKGTFLLIFLFDVSEICCF